MTTSTPLSRAENLADRHVAHIDLLWSPQLTQPWPCNAGFENARTLLASAAERHPTEVSLVEAEYSADQALQLYETYVKPSASGVTEGSWNYRVSGVFGSNQYPGCWTAREVPLLVVTFSEVGTPLVAPHEERRRSGSSERPLRTILDVLQMLRPEDQEHFFGTQLG